jgi:hypothetical protein
MIGKADKGKQEFMTAIVQSFERVRGFMLGIRQPLNGRSGQLGPAWGHFLTLRHPLFSGPAVLVNDERASNPCQLL